MDAEDVEDHRLRLIFTCCHPALPLATSTALTLRTVAGLPVPVIARAFLVSETAMAQRLVRARRKIEHAGIPYRVPPPELLEERLNGVLTVLYLAFNAGYTDVALADVAASAVLLAEAVVDLMPLRVRSVWPPRTTAAAIVPAHRVAESSWRSAHPRGAGPHVVDPFRHRPRRRGAGFCPRARPVRAPGQDRGVSRHRDMCRTDGLVADRRAVRRAPAPVADASRRAESRDRCRYAGRARRGLALLDCISTELDGFHLVQAAQADLLRRAGRTTDAAERYRQAIALAPTARERGQLELRLATLTT